MDAWIERDLLFLYTLFCMRNFISISIFSTMYQKCEWASSPTLSLYTELINMRTWWELVVMGCRWGSYLDLHYLCTVPTVSCLSSVYKMSSGQWLSEPTHPTPSPPLEGNKKHSMLLKQWWANVNLYSEPLWASSLVPENLRSCETDSGQPMCNLGRSLFCSHLC